jgi:hypothetical protein
MIVEGPRILELGILAGIDAVSAFGLARGPCKGSFVAARFVAEAHFWRHNSPIRGRRATQVVEAIEIAHRPLRRNSVGRVAELCRDALSAVRGVRRKSGKGIVRAESRRGRSAQIE